MNVCASQERELDSCTFPRQATRPSGEPAIVNDGQVENLATPSGTSTSRVAKYCGYLSNAAFLLTDFALITITPKLFEYAYPSYIIKDRGGYVSSSELIEIRERCMCLGSACGNGARVLLEGLRSDVNSCDRRTPARIMLIFAKAAICSYAAYEGCRFGLDWGAYLVSYPIFHLSQNLEFYRVFLGTSLSCLLPLATLDTIPMVSPKVGIGLGGIFATLTSKMIDFSYSLLEMMSAK